MAKMKHMFADHIKEIDNSMSVEILDSNRTIIAAKLNDQAGDEPELVNCRSMPEVFATYRPRLETQVKNDQGETEDCNLDFKAIKDFSVDSVIAQCETLERQRNEKLMLAEFLKAVGANATLRKALDDPKQRTQLLNGFKTALNALGGNN